MEVVITIVGLLIIILLLILHDWYYTYKYRRSYGYVTIISEINTAISRCREYRKADIDSCTDCMIQFCESISTMFSTLKGERISTSIKLLTTDGNGKTILITQARDHYSSSHGRKSGSADTTEHTLEGNSDFAFIYRNFNNDLIDSTYFCSNNLVTEDNYSNSRLISWDCKPIPLIPKKIKRYFSWPLKYKSTLLVPIMPLSSNSGISELKGFLCIDSKRTHVFNIPEDKEILRCLAAELCLVVDTLLIHLNTLDNES